MTESDASSVASFLLPMLEFTTQRRASAKKCLEHPWFDVYRGGAAAGAEDDAGAGGAGVGKQEGSGEVGSEGGEGGATQVQEDGPPEV
jgi:hypothetical protein